MASGGLRSMRAWARAGIRALLLAPLVGLGPGARADAEPDILDRLGGLAVRPVHVLDRELPVGRRVAGIEALAGHAPAAALPLLHGVLAREPRGPALSAAIAATARLGKAESVRPLVDLVDRLRPPPEAALVALASIGDPKALSALVERWSVHGAPVTRALAHAGERAFDSLVDALKTAHARDAEGLLIALAEAEKAAPHGPQGPTMARRVGQALAAHLTTLAEPQARARVLGALARTVSRDGFVDPAPFLSALGAVTVRAERAESGSVEARVAAAALGGITRLPADRGSGRVPGKSVAARRRLASAVEPLLIARAPEVRAAALRAWVRHVPDRSDKVLRRSLADPARRVRAAARRLLHASTVPAHASLLAEELARNPRPEAAAGALARLPSGLPLLVRAVTARRGQVLAPALALALRRRNDDRAVGGSDALGALRAALSGAERRGSRALVLRALARDSEVAGQVVEALAAPDPGLRAAAALAALWLREAVADRVRLRLPERIAKESDPEACRRMAELALAIAAPVGPQLAPSRLTRVRARGCGPELMRWLAGDPQACAHRGYREALRALARGDHGAGPRRRAAAVASLGVCGDRRARPRLLLALEDGSDRVALAAVDALAKLGFRGLLEEHGRLASRSSVRLSAQRASRAAVAGPIVESVRAPARGPLWIRLGTEIPGPQTVELLGPGGYWRRMRTFPHGELVLLEAPLTDLEIRKVVP
ncbi:MAG: hypothetical protein OXU20_01615 [Myxococcales bacterium]|nr:hypothetical protein [Myxococcales bacterium]